MFNSISSKEKDILFSSIFEIFPNAVLFCEQEKIKKVNKQVLDLFKIKSSSVINDKTILDISPKFQLDRMLSSEKFKKILSLSFNSSNPNFEWLFLDFEGNEFSAEIRILPHNFEGVHHSFIVISNINEVDKCPEIQIKIEQMDLILAKNINNLIIIHDINGIIADINYTSSKLLGFSPNEMIGNNFFELLQIEDKEIVNAHCLINHDKSINNKIQCRIKNKSGSFEWFEICYNHFENLNSSKEYFICTATNINKQIEAETQFKTMQLYCDKIFNGIQSAMFQLEPDKNGEFIFTRANNIFLNLAGMTENRLISKPIKEIFNAGFSENLVKKIKTCAVNDSQISFEDFVSIESKEYIWHIILTPVLQDKQLKFISASVINITDVKIADSVIQHQKQLTYEIINNAPLAIWLINLDNEILMANEYFKKNISSSYGKITLTNYEQNSYQYSNEIALNQSIPYLSEEEITFIDGEKHNLQMIRKKMHDVDGTLIGLLIIGLDITERKDLVSTLNGLVEDLHLSNEMLESILHEKNILINELDIAKNEQQCLNKQKDLLFSIIAHDLRSPLSGFMSITEFLNKHIDVIDKNEVKELTVELKQSAENVYKLLENLLEWSKLQRGLITYQPEPCNLNSVIDNIVDIYEETAKKKGLKLIRKLEKNIYPELDIPLFSIILRNLISNAIKYTKSTGFVTVSSFLINKNKFCVSVKDTGIGMPESILKNLFDFKPQNQRKGTENEMSNGLGLILCKEFAEKQLGNIRVESKENEGSTFYFELPVKEGNE